MSDRNDIGHQIVRKEILQSRNMTQYTFEFYVCISGHVHTCMYTHAEVREKP